MILLCLPNKSKQKIEKAKDDYFKIVNDIDPASQKKSDNNTLAFKNILTEFFVVQPIWLHNSFECVHTKYFAVETLLLSTTLRDTPDQPPEC